MKQKKFAQLKLLYLLVFALGCLIIIPTHIFREPYFMFARFPHYLEKMGPFLGLKWPVTFKIYHLALYTLTIILSVNVLGIIFPKFKKVSQLSSLIGIPLILLMILFFIFVFVKVNLATSIVYGFFLLCLLIVDAITFLTLNKQR